MFLLFFRSHKPAKSRDFIDAWQNRSGLSQEHVISDSSDPSQSPPLSPTPSDIHPPSYDFEFKTNSLYFGSNPDLYSNIPSPVGVTSATTGATNRSYIFEDDLYATANHRNGIKLKNGKALTHRSLSTESHVLPGSLDRRLVNDLYSKPMKEPKNRKAKSVTSLGNGSFGNNGNSAFNQRHTVQLTDDDEIYGYTTSLA